MEKKIAIIDDVFLLANQLKVSIEDDFFVLDPQVLVVNTPKAIDEFNPDGFGLLIIDQNLFNGFNARSEMLEGFTQGESMAKKFIDGGYRGRIVLYTGDYELVEKRNNPTFFDTLFGGKKPEGVVYINRGSAEGQKQLKNAIKAYMEAS